MFIPNLCRLSFSFGSILQTVIVNSSEKDRSMKEKGEIGKSIDIPFSQGKFLAPKCNIFAPINNKEKNVEVKKHELGHLDTIHSSIDQLTGSPIDGINSQRVDCC
jgi:hypothetical protein